MHSPSLQVLKPCVCWALVVLTGICCGCVERTLTIASNPPDALVHLNDQEVGRTPFSRRFLWYGTYEVQVRHEGYETLNTATPVIAPWWQWVPFDLLAELAPLKLYDEHRISYTLKPLSRVQVDPEAIVERGERLAERLESGRPKPPPRRPKSTPRHPTTRPKHQ